jgi:hypothetical protein
VATHSPTRGLRMKCPIPLPRHRARTLLFARTTQRPSHTHWLGGTRPTHPSAPTRPRVVAYGAQPEQRAVHLQAHRDRLPPRRLRRLRVGSRIEQRLQLPSPRFLERYRPATTHHVEGTPSSPTRSRVVSTPTKRPARPTTRGQHNSGRRAHKAYLPVTSYDDRTTPLTVPARHQRHPYPPELHPVSQYTQPRTGHRGLATHPAPIRAPPGPVGTPHYRPVHVHAKRSTTTVQRPEARPAVRGRRLLTPSRRSVAA